MNLTQVLLNTKSENIGELEEEYNFKLTHIRFEAIISEETGVFSCLKDVEKEIDKLWIPTNELKITLTKKEEAIIC